MSKPLPEGIKEYFFTFGVKYRQELHPVFSTTELPDHYVVMEAPDEETARQMMTAVCGDRWAFVYDREPDPRWCPKGELTRFRWQPTAGLGGQE